MSSEKLEFELPLSFNIGIKDEPECVMRYLRYFSDQAALTPVVNGIIMGETRVIAASMSIEQIFQDRKTFRDYVSKHIQTELDQFGLQIYNANIKELKDAPGSEYFKYRAAKTMQTTINQSKADVAVASTKGVVGQKERESAQRQENSRIEADAIKFETIREAERAEAKAKFAVQNIEYELNIKLANIESAKKALCKDLELQKTLEIQRGITIEEQLIAEKLSQVKVEAQRIVKVAEADYYKTCAEADAKLYSAQKSADALKMAFRSQAQGIVELSGSLKGDNEAIIKYLMVEKEAFQNIAKGNTGALSGLKPHLNIMSAT